MNVTKDTRIAVGLGATILIAAVGASWTIRSALAGYDERISVLESDRYTLTQASEQALRTAIENPGLRVPDPRNPGQVVMVRGGG